jgi:hypothetical protein
MYQVLKSCFCWKNTNSSRGPANVQRVIESRVKAWHPCLHFVSMFFSLSLPPLQSPWSPGRARMTDIHLHNGKEQQSLCRTDHPPGNRGFLILRRPWPWPILRKWARGLPPLTARTCLWQGRFRNYSYLSSLPPTLPLFKLQARL